MVGGMAARLQVQRFVNSRASRQVITRDTSLTYDLECYVSFTVREPIIIQVFEISIPTAIVRAPTLLAATSKCMYGLQFGIECGFQIRIICVIHPL